jgi:hypothetical protein
VIATRGEVELALERYVGVGAAMGEAFRHYADHFIGLAVMAILSAL